MAKRIKKQSTTQPEEINPIEQTPVETPVDTAEKPKEDVETILESPVLKSILSTLQATMSLGSGTGADSPQIRAVIKEYLGREKVQLEELDEAIMQEIKRNQTIELKLPNFATPIEVTQSNTQIPHFYEILDDILAGNNVYLIGEAGGGKTYTAEVIAGVLKRKYVTLNCSQYTSPLEVLGGQSVEGFKQGKLIDCWRNGKILIIDEMPKLDPNTAGLFNDALAKSSKTRSKGDARINSANAEEPPIERNDDFGIIATGNIYPNTAPPEQYKGNNQQDLSLLDRFSGSVYYIEYAEIQDQLTTRFKFLYDFLIGNYHDYIRNKRAGTTLPTPRGLRTILEQQNAKNMALVSYRTNISFRIAFEYELVRAIAKKEGNDVTIVGKTLANAFDSWMVAFKSSTDTYNNIMNATGYTESYIKNLVADEINKITSSEDGFYESLNEVLQKNGTKIFKRYSDFYAVEPININNANS